MNIECDNETLTELEHAFKFNDAVIRHLTMLMTEAVTAPSPMMKEEKSRAMPTTEDAAKAAAGAAPAGAAAAPAPAPAAQEAQGTPA
jgi:small subunit ribosomal protein S6